MEELVGVDTSITVPIDNVAFDSACEPGEQVVANTILIRTLLGHHFAIAGEMEVLFALRVFDFDLVS